jgi:hypothetical protein
MYMYPSETDRQLMLDYETLDEAINDPELPTQIASGYFAVLSGKMFDFREKEDGDDKVSLQYSLAVPGLNVRPYYSVIYKDTSRCVGRPLREASSLEPRPQPFHRWRK